MEEETGVQWWSSKIKQNQKKKLSVSEALLPSITTRQNRRELSSSHTHKLQSVKPESLFEKEKKKTNSRYWASTVCIAQFPLLTWWREAPGYKVASNLVTEWARYKDQKEWTAASLSSSLLQTIPHTTKADFYPSRTSFGNIVYINTSTRNNKTCQYIPLQI